MNHCEKCHGELAVRKVPLYEDKLLGIQGVAVVDAVEESVCVKCGQVALTTIPDLSELIAAAAVWRVMIPIKLHGQEIKFLRQALNWQSKKFAEKLGVRPETVSRWENGEDIMSPTNERLLRLMVGTLLREEAPAIEFEEEAIISMTIQGPRSAGATIPMTFCRVLVTPAREGWNARRARAA
jgi:DNA-binding XRE family transcriptional regulator